MAIPPPLGMGHEWTFLLSGKSRACTLIHIFLKIGIRAMLMNMESNNVEKRIILLMVVMSYYLLVSMEGLV